LRQAAERERLGRNAQAVAGLLDQALEALRAGDAARAEVLLQAAGKRADEGGADGSSGRLERLRTDLAVLKALEEVDRFRWTPTETQFPDPAAVAARYREALAPFGLSPESPAEAAARVSGSAVRTRLVAALDRWLSAERLPWLREVLRAADRHPFRDAVR